MHFGVETTNRAKSEHSVLKLWFSTCHGDLDTVFLNIDSLIEGQIADIKTSLEFSKTKEKHNAKSNHIFYIVSNKISHLAFKKIWSEITRAAGIYDDPKNKCRQYLRTSHGLPCACELITQFEHVLPIHLHDINAFWMTLEIGDPHPSAQQQDMDSEMRSLTDLLHQISTGPISKVREMRRLVKKVLNPIFPEDPGVTLTSPPEVAVTKGRKKTNSTKETSHIGSTGSVSGSGTGSRSGSRGRGRPPRAPRERGRRRDHGRSSLSANVIGDGNCVYRVVADFVFGNEHQWPEVCRRMLYELEHSTNLYVNLVGSEERVNELVHRIHWPVDRLASYTHWFETPDSLYIIANAFNLCVILIAQLGSTTVLPLYSYLDRPEGTLVIGLLTEERHFIQLQLNDMCLIPPLYVQWIHHCSEWVSNWADSYQHRIADWNARVARNGK
ncbi:hypothetical protein M9H77_17979 [Catharanthus roseus]|uniref:Uncharacterized protein n=1 Tax=Catharanthus roseus TaxID=4058 RepID=A0ACC0B670_CATRO|nr:hypothetical protein M9H77_17979 [Catharanthus roseus]